MERTEKTAFAERLRELRARLGLSQKSFAERVNISPTSLSAYETGAKSPTIQIAARIAGVCRVSLDWLCGLPNDTSTPAAIDMEGALHAFGQAFLSVSQLNLVQMTDLQGDIQLCVTSDSQAVLHYIDAVKSLSQLNHDTTLDDDMYLACIDTACKKAAKKYEDEQRWEDSEVPF